ncbi:class I SAM-dependent methyltransferase [bacterium]|nr:class I SAM-dependent methyltransferase [bacterium]
MAPAKKKQNKYRPYYSDYYKSFRRFILPISLILGILGYGLYYVMGSFSFVVIIPLTLALLLYLLLEVVHQISLITGNHYQFGIQQAQSIQAIYSILKPELPLPSMAKWAGNPDFCQLVAKQILSSSPGVILEFGSGASTIVAGLALRRTGGKLISIDHDNKFATETAVEIQCHNLSDSVQVLHCPLTEVTVDSNTYLWYDLSLLGEIPTIDLLIIDGPPSGIQKHSRYPALPMLYDKLAENAVILLDDGRRADEQDIVRMWKDRYDDLNVQSIGTEKGAFLLSRSGR